MRPTYAPAPMHKCIPSVQRARPQLGRIGGSLRLRPAFPVKLRCISTPARLSRCGSPRQPSTAKRSYSPSTPLSFCFPRAAK
jgi:hypothetical protein